MIAGLHAYNEVGMSLLGRSAANHYHVRDSAVGILYIDRDFFLALLFISF